MRLLSLTADDYNAALLSVRVSTVAVGLMLVPSVLAGCWLARSQSRLRALVETVLVAPLVIPPVVTGYGLLILASRLGLSVGSTWWTAVLASGVVSFPLLIRTVRAAAESVDPRLGCVAATLGASPARVFATVTLPMIWPAVVGGTALAWARAFGEFGATIVVAGNTPGVTRTLPLAMYTDWIAGSRSPWPLAILAVVIALGAVAVAEWLIRRTRSGRTHAALQAGQDV